MVWVLRGVVGSFEEDISDGFGSPGAVVVYLIVGALLGVLWYRLYPRPFVGRVLAIARVVLVPAAIVAAIAVTVLIGSIWDPGSSFGVHLDRPTPDDITGPVALVGLFAFERRQRRAAVAVAESTAT